MTEGKACEDCTLHYVASGAVVGVVWVSLALAMLIYRMKREGPDDSTSSRDECEMEETVEMRQDTDNSVVYTQVEFNDNVNRKKPEPGNQTVYSSVVFNDGKQKQSSEEPLVYSELAFNGNKTPKAVRPNVTENEVTYASVNIKPQPQADNSDLYAVVKKKS
ncbi:uncharacterized protein O3C94_001373 isoform 1-T2 [Discoglossus pictus]